MMKVIYIFVLMLASFTLSTAQTSFEVKREKPVARFVTTNMTDFALPEAFIEYVEYPKPGGKYYNDFLASQKELSAKLFPNGESRQEFRTVVDTPELISNFPGNSWNAGIPLDNHLAVSNDGQIVTVVNTQLVVLDNTGFYQGVFNLDAFWETLGEDQFYFDPRIIYDPVEDRFIMAMMQDFDCEGSNIVFAFSASSDATGDWNLYKFEGCPKSDATFADFPMISITDKELFFTYNAVYQDSSWQTGFAETFIYQIDKFDGYSGEELDWQSWSELILEGRLLRYICPIKYATEEMGSDCFFMSNRSFDVQNDTIWMVHISSTLEDPVPQLEIQFMLSNVPYGVPPNATQPKDRLQTNDARVLDGFLIEDQIQFVSSTVDPATGLSAIYHGIVDDIYSAPLLTGTILGDETDHRAYPGIAYCGVNPGDRDAIIVALHASPDRFPGYSGLYSNFGYSEWMTIKEGQRVIDMFKVNNPFGVDPTLERWGDYVGIQPQYNEDGTVWTAAVYGKPGSVNDTWVGYLSRPVVETSTADLDAHSVDVRAFPNPASNHLTIDIEGQPVGGILQAQLFDIQGKMIELLYTEEISRQVPVRFHYNTSKLTSGSYTVVLSIDGRRISSQTIIIQ